MFTTPLKLTSYDIHPNDSAKMSSLLKYMQEAGRDNLDQLGFTYHALRDIGMFFALTRLTLEMKKPFLYPAVAQLSTWPRPSEGLYFYRDFELDIESESIASASTQWVLMDFNSRKLLRPKAFPKDLCTVDKSNNVEITKSLRSVFNGVINPAGLRAVRLSDLDQNGHLNNAIYADIATDLCDAFDYHSFYVNKIQISFINEAYLGDCIDLEMGVDEKKSQVFVCGSRNDAVCFECLLGFEKL